MYITDIRREIELLTDEIEHHEAVLEGLRRRLNTLEIYEHRWEEHSAGIL